MQVTLSVTLPSGIQKTPMWIRHAANGHAVMPAIATRSRGRGGRGRGRGRSSVVVAPAVVIEAGVARGLYLTAGSALAGHANFSLIAGTRSYREGE